MFSSEAESKYKNIIYNWIRSGRYLKRENLFLDVVPEQREFANLSGFQFS